MRVLLVNSTLSLLCLFCLNSWSANPFYPAKVNTQHCQTCHQKPNSPQLLGQQPNYFLKRWLDFNQQETNLHKTFHFSSEETKALALYFFKQKSKVTQVDAQLAYKGQKLFLGGNKQRHIPACSSCHSPIGLGNNEAKVPRLAGQREKYIETQLLAFQKGSRKSDRKKIMRGIAKKLSKQEIKALAVYLAGLYPRFGTR